MVGGLAPLARRRTFREHEAIHCRSISMVPLYAARIADLGTGDLVQIECVCGHVTLLTAQMLATAGVAADQKLVDLPARLRCRECDERARAVVSVKWREAGGKV